MPNWCTNVVGIKGSIKEVRRVKRFLRGKIPNYAGETDSEEKSIFCFHKVIPIPKEILEHGYNNPKANIDGYRWQITEWGTKWTACAEEVIRYEVSKRLNKSILIYRFETAWAEPQPVIQKLSELFPRLTITLIYTEPGMAFGGKVVYKGGRILSEKEYEGDRFAKRFNNGEFDADVDDLLA